MRETVKLTVQMKKNARPTYLDEDKESLVIASAEIEGGHGLTFYCNSLSEKFQEFSKAVKSRCGDINILIKYSMSYFQEVINRFNRMEDEHEDQKIISRTGLVKVSRLRVVLGPDEKNYLVAITITR